MERRTKLALVGAGYIADVHAQAVQSLGEVLLQAVVDPNLEAARNLANRFNIEIATASLEECLQSCEIDCAHILVPPPLHAPVAQQWLDAGVSVFLEKPMAETAQQCVQLIEKAKGERLTLGVNQNFIHHPAYRRLLNDINRGQIGRIQSVSAVFSMPLRQLESGQLGHWMFAETGNILLEQAVHPLSQLEHLCGPLKLNHVDVQGEIRLGPGHVFYKEWRIALRGRGNTCVTLYFRVGSNFPVFQIDVLGSDGTAHADMVRNWSASVGRTQWPDAYDHMTTMSKYGKAVVSQARSGFRDFVFCQLGLKPRNDAFYLSMKESIRAFHAARNANDKIESDGVFGAKIVTLCEEIAAYAPQGEKALEKMQLSAGDEAQAACEIAVLGGTGFIGRALVRQLVDAGKTLRVMARSTAILPAIFYHPNVQLMSGDVRKEADVRRCIKGTNYVVNLAHGGGGATRDAIYDALVGSAVQVGKICLEEQVKQLVYISSIAALYLGDGKDIITPSTRTDEKSERRNDYAWAKAEAEREMLRLYENSGLNVHIQRPGLVVGEGTSPLHSGLGFFNNEQHCIGWNRGHNPLPFVLVEDTASAIAQAIGREGLAGKSDNIIGDVRPNARTYYNHLRQLSGRPLCYHPQNPLFLQLSEIFKWVIKRISGRNAPFPSYRDILSRGLKARFDCTETKARLDWSPCADEAQFYQKAIGVVIGQDT